MNNNTVTDRKAYVYLNGELIAINNNLLAQSTQTEEEVIIDNDAAATFTWTPT